MKTTQALLPAAFAAMALAQSSISYTTITAYTDICSGSASGSSSGSASIAPESISSTTTSTIISEVCAVCSEGKAPATMSGVLTTYTTVFLNVCPTGSTLTPATYTVTEPCPSESVGQPLPATHMPQGFTTTVTTCACEGGSATLTIPAQTAAPTAAASAPASAPTTTGAGAGAGAPAPAAGSPAASAPGSPAGSSPAEGSSTPEAPAGAAPEDSTVDSSPAAATVTNSVNLATNGSSGSSNGTGYSPSNPIPVGTGSRPVLSMCATLLAAIAVVVYAL